MLILIVLGWLLFQSCYQQEDLTGSLTHFYRPVSGLLLSSSAIGRVAGWTGAK
jgi:hypothetical protein